MCKDRNSTDVDKIQDIAVSKTARYLAVATNDGTFTMDLNLFPEEIPFEFISDLSPTHLKSIQAGNFLLLVRKVMFKDNDVSVIESLSR